MKNVNLATEMTMPSAPATAEKEFYLVGFPRSGHTWMQNLLADLLFKVDSSQVTDEVIQRLIPDVYQQESFDKSLSPKVFKSHDMPMPEYKNVIYLIRDGRDVILSFYHFQKALKPEGGDYFSPFGPVNHAPVTWAEHVEGWLRNPYQAKILFVYYEMLHTQPAVELNRVCNFLGVTRSKSEIAQAIEHASFDKMQAKEKKLGWSNLLWPKDKLFLRSGKIGGYKQNLPPDVLEIIEKRHGRLLNQLGYSVKGYSEFKRKVVSFLKRTHAMEFALSACYVAESILELL
jgi:hypothetical protein